MNFTTSLENFRIALENLCNEHLQKNFDKLAVVEKIRIDLEHGTKFVRVVRRSICLADGLPINGSAHCFVEVETGKIFKAAGWKAPEKKNPRGSIYNANPLEGVTVYGVVYLR